MSEHVYKVDRNDRARRTFACSCGVRFAVSARAGELLGAHVEGEDPRRCPGAVDAVMKETGVSFRSEVFYHFDVALGRIDIATGRLKATVTHSQPTSGFAPSDGVARISVFASAGVVAGGSMDVENRSENGGGGRVSRPPQSASTSAKSSQGQDRKLAPDGDCESTKDGVRSVAPCVDDTSPRGADDTSDPSPTAANDTSPRGADDTSDPSPTAVCLANQVDTLEVSWDVAVARKRIELLEQAKKASQEATQDGPAQEFVMPGGVSFLILPKGGRRHQFILENKVAILAVSKCGSETLPSLRFKFRCEATWTKGVRGAWEWGQAIALAVHEEAVAEREAEAEDDEAKAIRPPCAKVSRIDLCADFLHLGIEDADEDHFVTRARRRGRFKKGIVMDDLDMGAFRVGRRKTGYSFGKGDLAGRVYDKTQEIHDQSPDKVWLYGFWKRCAACGCRENEHEGVEHKASIVGNGRCAREGCDCASFVVDEAGFMDARPCEACSETGQVVRVVRCSECRNGKKKKLTCTECQATGQRSKPTACKACKGKKATTDRVFRVEPQLRREALTELVKAVERTCPTCSGVGARVFTRKCKPCRGTGGFKCLSCHGTGENRRGPCARCKGDGSVQCKRCAGEGARAKNKACRKCSEKGVILDKPTPEELVDPQGRLVIRDDSRGAKSVGEDLELEIDTLEGLMRSLKAIWRYCVGGGRGVRPWLSWRKPNGSEQPTRWPMRDEWRVVQAGPDWESDMKDELVRFKRCRAKLRQAIPALGGYLSLVTALATANGVRPTIDFALALAWEDLEVHFEKRSKRVRGGGWDDTVDFKRDTLVNWGALGAEVRDRALGLA